MVLKSPATLCNFEGICKSILDKVIAKGRPCIYAFFYLLVYVRKSYAETIKNGRTWSVAPLICRGIERRRIFKDDEDRVNFLKRLGGIFSETKTSC